MRFAPVRFAPVRFAPVRFAPVRLCRVRFRFDKSTPLRLTCCSSVGSCASEHTCFHADAQKKHNQHDAFYLGRIYIVEKQ